MYADIQVRPEDVISEETVVQAFPSYEGGAIGSGTNDETEQASLPLPLGRTEAEHMAVYLRRIYDLADKMCDRLGLSREALRAGAKPEREVTPDERHQIGELSHGLARIEALVGPENDGVVRPYAEDQVLQVLSAVEREIDAEELRVWLPPPAQEALQVEDCRQALERLAEGSVIRSRTVLLAGNASYTRYGRRTLFFRGCGILHRVFQAPFRPPTLKR